MTKSSLSIASILLAGAVAVSMIVTASAVFSDRADAQSAGSGAAKNVIFMMGDGMGSAQREAIQLASVGPYDNLVMDSLPVTGLVGTDSVDPKNPVTDSAAAATAFASGVKTINGTVGLDPGGNTVPTILEQAKAAGKSVGLVTTSQVTDASPAAFASHVKDRDKQSEIARQYIEKSQPDVILGGGEDFWYPKGDEGAYPDKTNKDDEETSQSDQGNLIDEAKQAGYEYVTNASELSAASGPKVLGLFANEEMFQQFPEGEGDEYNPVVPLPDMTQKAIDVLSQNPNGFFLFVEEEGTDEMGHANNSPLTIKSGQALDKAVGVAKGYADQSGNTLLITTADHEVGGLAIEETVKNEEAPDESGGHEKAKEANVSTEDGPFPVANSNYKFVMDWTTTGHTGADVPLTATGPGAEQLTGNYENTHIYDAMAESLGVTGMAPSAATSGASTMPDTGGMDAKLLSAGPVLGLASLLCLGGGLLLRSRLRHKT